MIRNKVTVITGGSSGIGLALAHHFAKNGNPVVISGRNEQKLNEAADAVRKHGQEVLAVVSDVAKREDCEKLMDAAVDKFGRIDILINNAGISMRAMFEDVEVEVIERLMQINFFGMVYCTKYALPHILKSKGSIVGISSIAGFRGLPGRTGYSASKFAMHGFLESLRTELMDAGVHVLLACPGFTASNIRNTALTADGSQQGESPRDEAKMMTAEEVAARIFEAVGKRRRSLVLTSQGKLTVFFNKWLPKWMDKKVKEHFEKEGK